MLYLWLVVALALVVAVVLVALGRGSSPSEAAPDRRAADLPTGRPIVAADIDGLRLPQAFRGYRMADVDEVLDRLAEQLTARDALIDRLRHPTPDDAP